MKRFLSIILFICLLCCSAFVPVYAENEFPENENADFVNTGDEKIITYDCITHTETITDASALKHYDGSGTYAYLSNEEMKNTIELPSEMMSEQSASSFYAVDPSLVPYSGVVLFAVTVIDQYNNVYFLSVGSGFMVSGKIMVMAAHNIVVTVPAGYSLYEWRVYPGVNVDQINEYDYSCLNSYNYYTLSSYSYSSLYTPGGVLYDWCVAKLNSTINNCYYFNCFCFDSSIIGEDSWAIGYPKGSLFRMHESYGEVLGVFINNLVTVSNQLVMGMSGGPIYVGVYGRDCMGIIIRDNGTGTLIYPFLYDIILNSIIDSQQ